MKNLSLLSKCWLLFSLFALVLVTTSCKDDEENTPQPTFTLVGNWKFASLTLANGAAFPLMSQVESDVPCIKEMKFLFKEDKSFTTEDCLAAVTYLSQILPLGPGTTWEDKDSKLTLKNGTISKELAYATSKDAAGKNQINITVPINLAQFGMPGGGEILTKFTFTKL